MPTITAHWPEVLPTSKASAHHISLFNDYGISMWSTHPSQASGRCIINAAYNGAKWGKTLSAGSLHASSHADTISDVLHWMRAIIVEVAGKKVKEAVPGVTVKPLYDADHAPGGAMPGVPPGITVAPPPGVFVMYEHDTEGKLYLFQLYDSNGTMGSVPTYVVKKMAFETYIEVGIKNWIQSYIPAMDTPVQKGGKMPLFVSLKHAMDKDPKLKEAIESAVSHAGYAPVEGSSLYKEVQQASIVLSTPTNNTDPSDPYARFLKGST